MTQPPGRTAHYDGDGCTGQDRTVDSDGAEAIRYRAKRIITRAAVSAWPEAVIHGDWVADHYGRPGEYFLSTLLAAYIRQSHQTPAASSVLGGPPPQLALTVPDGDPEAADLFEYQVSHRRLTGSPIAQWEALGAVRLSLQTFLLHLHVGDTRAARRHWLNLYDHGKDNPLIPPAFATLLITWAARSVFGTRQLATNTAPLN